MRKSLSKLLGAVAGAVAMLAVAGCSGAGAAAAARLAGGSIKVAVPSSLNGLSAYVAQSRGYFEKQGLGAELTNVTSAAQVVPSLLSGTVDFGMVDVSTTTVARSKRVPLVMVAPNTVAAEPRNGVGYGNLLVANDSPIRSIEDVAGRSLGLSGLKSQGWVDIRTVLDDAGVDSAAVKYVEIPGPRVLSALRQGQVEVAAVSEPNASRAVQAKEARLLTPTDNPLTGTPSYVFVATEQFVAEHPAMVQKFTAAVLAANKALNADRDLAVAAAAEFTTVPAGVLKSCTYPTYGEEPLKAGKLRAVVDRAVRYDLVSPENEPSPASLIAHLR
ncbi:ABC transporter substrate-binding protein [Streptomyces sp. NPDC002577]